MFKDKQKACTNSAEAGGDRRALTNKPDGLQSRGSIWGWKKDSKKEKTRRSRREGSKPGDASWTNRPGPIDSLIKGNFFQRHTGTWNEIGLGPVSNRTPARIRSKFSLGASALSRVPLNYSFLKFAKLPLSEFLPVDSVAARAGATRSDGAC